MPGRTTLNISLPEVMRAWVETRVNSGEFANASDYVRDLMRHDQEQVKEALDANTVAGIRKGIADVRAGRRHDADQVLDRLERKYKADPDT
ncbi:MAG: type II toxin-antitoxin system ParD family antitoxin [Pseudomonadota bacterium]